MKCSLLSGHIYELHVLESPVCQCGVDYENTNPFLLPCSLFSAERRERFSSLLTLDITDVNTELLLKGSIDYNDDLNKEIFRFVHDYFDCTNTEIKG